MTPPDRGPALSLTAGHAHLWWVVPERFTDPDALARYRSALTDEERRKTDRFRFARDRQLCLIARVLVRTTLSRYDRVRASQWRFQANRYGRPVLSG